MIYGSGEFNRNLIHLIKSSSKEEAYRHPLYKESCHHAEEMSWHLYGNTPTSLLERTRPREDPEVTKYRVDNYEPTTKSAADKAINIVAKIFNPNLYSIRWKDQSESSKELQEYTLEYYPECNSIVNFMKDVLLRKMLADPNGVAAVRPRTIPESDAEQPEPILLLYGSPNIWFYDDEHYLIFTHEEVDTSGKYTIKWYYFEYYDKNQYISLKAHVSPIDELVQEEISFFPFDYDEIPIWKLQGLVESLDNGEIIYKSFFSSAAPYWNLSIIHESDVLGAFINHIHPQKYELSEPCNYRWEWMGTTWPCRSGKIKYGHGESSHEMDCPSCSGSGYRNMSGPYGVYKIAKEKLQEGDGPIGIDPVGYITVPVDATKMLEERADRMRQMGMWAINMDVEDEVGENQSGVAKVIDRSAQYDTLYNIGSVVFDVHLQNTYYFFNLLMNGVKDKSMGKNADSNLPQINKPTQFDTATTGELLNSYKLAKESGADPNYLQIKQEELVTRDLTTNPDLKKFAFLLLDLDPLPGMDSASVSMNVSKLFVRQVDAVIHFNIKRFIERAINENKNFTELKRDEQIKILEDYGNEMVKENKPKVDPNVLEYVQNEKKKAQASFV